MRVAALAHRGQSLAQIVGLEARLLATNRFGFRTLALTEMRKYSRSHLLAEGANLLHGVRAEDFRTWGPPGIRAQLFDVRQQKLEMDFCLEGDDRSMHVLNAVSPAFTCAFSFAEYVLDRVDEKLSTS